jgi:DNA-binding MarR family transcriptional regulator
MRKRELSIMSSDLCACGTVRKASRAITQFYDLVLAPSGLKATQFVLLKTISERGEIAQWDFARREAIAVETLSRRFAGLRRKGYIQVRTGTRHGEHLYSITEKGKSAYLNALPYWERAQQRLRMALGEGAWRTLLDLMSGIPEATLEAEELRTENQSAAAFSRDAAASRREGASLLG